MKFELSSNDLKAIKKAASSSEALYLKKIQEQKFEIGEICIYKTIEFEDEFCKKITSEYTEKYSDSLVDERFVVVHKDEDSNFYYLRRITVGGKMNKDRLLQSYHPDTHVGYCSYSFYETDPLAVDAILMGEEFDLSPLLKEEIRRKDVLVDMNKKNSVVFTSLEDVNEWAKSLKAGQNIYYHTFSNSAYLENDYVTITLKKDPRRISMKDYMQQEHFKWKLGRGDYGNRLHKSADYVLMLRTSREGAKTTTADLIGYALHLTKPIDLKGTQ